MSHPIKHYLSYGAGVGSTALICYLLSQIKAKKVEVVFCDHGGDWPETYAYVDYIKKALNIEIMTIKVHIQKKQGLYDYFYSQNMVPLHRYRSCTDKGKIRPFHNYIEKPAGVSLGITWDERKRATSGHLRSVTNYYPLVDARITRTQAIELITNMGLKVPQKSGCYFCPFQGKREWKRLFDEHNELFRKAIELENNANTRILPSGKPLQALYDEFLYQSNIFQRWG